MTNPETIVAKTDSYTLTQIDGRLFLSALCGTAGASEMRIELNSEELRDYTRWGDHFVEGLARKIAHHPEAYRERNISKT